MKFPSPAPSQLSMQFLHAAVEFLPCLAPIPVDPTSAPAGSIYPAPAPAQQHGAIHLPCPLPLLCACTANHFMLSALLNTISVTQTGLGWWMAALGLSHSNPRSTLGETQGGACNFHAVELHKWNTEFSRRWQGWRGENQALGENLLRRQYIHFCS